MADADKQFSIRRVYLKDVSFESPLTPGVFLKRGSEPKIEMVVRVGHTAAGDDRYEVAVTATITAKLDEQVMFLCEVAQAGIFLIKGYGDAELDDLVNVACPVQLFPYVRTEVAHLTVMGGFPPVVLAPVDFQQMYAAAKRAAPGQA
jgi:preprotein translocase subunit SecB